jgi:N4-gp56 family major capsid protein
MCWWLAPTLPTPTAWRARVQRQHQAGRSRSGQGIRFLKVQNAKFIKTGIMPSDKVGTGSVRKAFIGLVHPDVEFDLESITGYRSVSDYGSQEGVIEDEIGAYKNIRFVSSTNCKIFAGGGAAGTTVFKNNGANFDVYATLIFADNAYGVCPLSGQAMQTYVKALGSAGTADPLEQRSTVGWKATTTTKILNDSWIGLNPPRPCKPVAPTSDVGA